MGRRARTHQSGLIYHVMSRGNERRDIFQDTADRLSFLGRLGELKGKLDFRIHAYCLMTNHFHLLIQVGMRAISEIMQAMLTFHAKRFNFRYSRDGHLFQSRFRSPIVDSDSYFLNALRYIHLNPVAAGIVGRPEDWSWSGHKDLLGWTPSGSLIDADYPLSLFSPNKERAVEEYVRFLSLDCKRENREVERLLSESLYTEGIIANSGTPLPALAALVCGEKGLALEHLTTHPKLPERARLRELFIQRAVDSGHLAADVARFLGCSKSAISRRLSTGRKSTLQA